MTDHPSNAAALVATIAELGQRLDSIEAKIVGFSVGVHEALTSDGDLIVRSGLDIVDDDGVARVRLRADTSGGSIRLRLNTPAGSTTGLELFAIEDPDGGSDPLVGMVRMLGGEIVEDLT